MNLSNITTKSIPDAPGVYFFLGVRNKILYIGKATSLRSRIRSYFDADIKEKRSSLIAQMVDEAKKVEYTVCDSVLEAMLLETNLIRTHKPRYNTKAKDDKSYNHVVITKEAFPRVYVMRGKDVAQADESEFLSVYGPFPSGALFKEAIKIIRKLFQFYDKDVSPDAQLSKVRKGKLDFNRQIGLYPDQISKKEYKQTIKHIQLFFEGKKEKIIKDLTKSMHAYAKEQEFEKADALKKKIFALEHIQDVALIKDETRGFADEHSMRFEAYDVAHLAGKEMVGVMTVTAGSVPQKSEYRKFIIKTVDKSNDTAALKEIITRRFEHPEWPMPNVIVVDGSTPQKRVVETFLKKQGMHIPVVAVVKDDRHRPKKLLGPKPLVTEHETAILLANAEAHRFAISFHKDRRAKRFLKKSS